VAVITASERRASAAAAERRRAGVRNAIVGAVRNVVGVGIFVFVFFPIIWLIDTSFKTAPDSWAVPVIYIPLHPTLENYQALISGQASGDLSQWPHYFVNSIVTAGVASLLVMTLATIAGYSFARFRFRGATALLMFLLVSQMLPGPSIFVSIYLLMSRLDLLDSLPGLIVVYMAFGLPFATWLATSFLSSIPVEIEEAAQIDGGSLFQVFTQIVVPLSKIGLITIAILTFVGAWADYSFASVLIETQSRWTATVAMAKFITDVTISFASIGAAAALLCLPVLILFLFAQRSFVRGLTAGALKEF
jgi:multiple sugar transport system permease protein